MRLNRLLPLALAMFLASCLPAAAQLSTAEPDPLARIRDAAKSNVQACSATGENLCEQVAPKIIANAQGDSPLAENIRRLREELGGANGASAAARAVAWSLAAFHDAGLDAHVEKYKNPNGGTAEQENVMAEFRGRENPDVWVLVGAHLGPRETGPGAADNSCDAASVIEAARDISRTAIHPRFSIRFVLFTGDERVMPGSWGYVRSHRAELDRSRAAIMFHSGCQRLTGYLLNGRHDIEPGLREAMKPIESLGGNQYFYGASMKTEDFDFLVEGVPTLSAIPELTTYTPDSSAVMGTPDKIEIADLKHNTAVVAVTAFGIAERAVSIGPRQSRAEIDSLLKTLDMDQQMKIKGLWTLWESGERGRLP
jgi:hypothetical protein